MATPTYDLLDSTTLTSSASSVTFSGISGDYRDLVLVVEWKGSGGNANALTRFNSDTGSNYSYVDMEGDGSATASGSGTLTYFPMAQATTTAARSFIMQIMDYSATDKHKSILQRSNRADTSTVALAGRWASTSAISTVQVYTAFNNYASGSTFYLYGVAA